MSTLIWLFFGFWACTNVMLFFGARAIYKLNNNFVTAFNGYKRLVIDPETHARRKLEDVNKTVNKYN